MTRRSFAEIVSGSGKNVADEYRSLHQLVFGNEGEYSDFHLSLIEEFELVPFRGTTLDVDDFNKRYGFERLVDMDESGGSTIFCCSVNMDARLLRSWKAARSAGRRLRFCVTLMPSAM
jgi:hypothetical protein